MEGNEILQRAVVLQQQSEEAERQLQFIKQQVSELEEFSKSLEALGKTKNEEVLVPIGKGVYSKAKVDNKEDFFVEVGAGVVLKKSAQETKEIINEQIKKFNSAKVGLSAHLESNMQAFQKMLHEVQK